MKVDYDLEAGEGPSSSSSCEQRTIRILVVDDSKLCRKFTIESISREMKSLKCNDKFLFQECEDGSDCVNIVKQDKSFDIICMDNIMTVMGGIEATKCVRALGFAGRVVGITGNVLKDDVKSFLDAGADLVLPKPVSSADLMKLLQSILVRV
jgi:hypothetical protein